MTEYTCDQCYEMRQEKVVICPECGEKTLISKVSGWSAQSFCTNCNFAVVSAGGYPQTCHVDDELYALTIKNPDDNKKLTHLAKLFSQRVLDLKAEFDQGDAIRSLKVMDCLEKMKALDEIEVAYEKDPIISKNYPRIQECPFR